ncbi:MAG TPA: AAA family ATPase [Candidatus Dormibacteraeota bacterium]|nr:AAA family ATPase [Candidatus Dormibacteraeota bacterium]
MVTRLRLANLRAIDTAEFRFQPGFNLIVGINGVGKTSVLDALGVCLSAVTNQTNKLHGRLETFTRDDIRVGAEALTLECDLRIGEGDHTYLMHKPLETSSPQQSKAGLPREQVHSTPQRAEFLGDPPSPVSGTELGGRPLAMLFSTNRAMPSERAPAKGVAAGEVAAAFGDAFADRELRLGEFAAWMRVQHVLGKERPQGLRVLTAFEDAVARFLPGYSSLRLGGEDGRQLWISRGGTGIPVRQLSDGERGTLALVLDLTRRLAQANPALADPAAEAGAVVLIDEIDLHLHPSWQRQIVGNLRAAFPRCQFIATTHSPQVIGQVEHDRIQIIANGEVYSPTHSYGVDSSRVLEEVMDTDPRATDVQDLLLQLAKSIGQQEFTRGHALLTQLVERLGDDDPEVTRVRTLLDFVEGKE